MKRIKISMESHCADASACCTAKNRRKWLLEHDLFIGSDRRVYALVDTYRQVYFMDAITGGLYSFGGFLSGERPDISFLRNHDKARQIMMDAFSEDGTWR